MKSATWLLLLLALFAGHALAVDGGTFVRDEVLREKPKANAKVLGKIEKGVKAELLRSKDAWYFVKIDKASGWVPVASIRRADSTFGAGIGDVGSAGGVQSTTKDAAGSMQALPGSAFHR